MGDLGMISSSHTRQESLLAAYHILRELEANESLTDDTRRVLSDINSKLSTLNLIPENNGPTISEFDEIEEQLKFAEEKIMIWESNNSMICESTPEMASEYIEAVNKVQSLVESFKGDEISMEIISKAEDILQVSMSRLEEELVYILVHKRQSYEPDELGQIIFDLIDPDAISFLESIKNTMFCANYDQEFCSTFIRIQKEALEDCLISLGMENLSIEELIKMEGRTLDSNIKSWIQVTKTAVQVYIAAEKRLCDMILGESGGPTASICFVNTTKSAMACLLNFFHAMALGPHKPEKLFNLLDMYQVLADLSPEVNALFSEEHDSFIKTEFQEGLDQLGDSVMTTFLGFGDVILSDPSTDPHLGGGVHPLTSYVMNYIVYLPDYFKTLNSLLKKKEKEAIEDGDYLLSIVTKLKLNLEKKSKLYKDVSLQHVFLMNNIHYIQQKVMGSEIGRLLGDKWIRMQIVNYQQHATGYLRTTWGPVVACLKDEGISGSGSGLKAILKERIRMFTVGFEEVYRTQTGWIIRDEQLKEELRIFISQKVILAYQSFIGRHSKYDIEKFVKYDYDDLEDFIGHFFEGSQKSLYYSRKR